MSMGLMITPEMRHLVKIADLDSLEQIARETTDEVDSSGIFEEVFEALDRRFKDRPEIPLAWGTRYIAWARSVPERDELPFLFTGWARRMVEIAQYGGRSDLALSEVDAMLDSLAPSERERLWWQRQHSLLTGLRHR